MLHFVGEIDIANLFERRIEFHDFAAVFHAPVELGRGVFHHVVQSGFFHHALVQQIKLRLEIIKTAGQDGKKRLHVLFFQVHQHAFGNNEELSARPVNILRPGSVEQRFAYGNGARRIRQQQAAFFNDLGQVQVVPADLAVIHALEPGVKTAADGNHHAIRVFFNEFARFAVHDFGTRQNAVIRGARRIEF